MGIKLFMALQYCWVSMDPDTVQMSKISCLGRWQGGCILVQNSGDEQDIGILKLWPPQATTLQCLCLSMRYSQLNGP